MSKKRVTYHELAKIEEVSPATVSRIVSGRQNVDAAIPARVLKVAGTLGVSLDRPRKEQSRTLAFVLGNRDVLHSFQARVLAGAESHVTSSLVCHVERSETSMDARCETRS